MKNHTIIHTPASADEATERLTAIDRVLRARHWERAAILATIVRLPGSGGTPDRKANRGSQVCSAEQLTERKIPGLRDANTIRLYVQRWLDAHDGRYPEADIDIELPTTTWPPVDKNDAGTRMPKAIDKAMDKLIEEHGVQAVIDELHTRLDDVPIDEIDTDDVESPEYWEPTRESRLRKAVVQFGDAASIISGIVDEGDLDSDEIALRNTAVDTAIEFAAALAVTP